MTTTPHHLPDPQRWAIEQERKRHDDALFGYGEYAMFILLWNFVDHELGLVERCPSCYISRGKIAEAYGQSDQNKCLACFGTTFEGGYKAKIVRPSLWDANEEDYRKGDRGQFIQATASVQSTSDFRLRTGDYIFRGDGTRWQMRTLSTNHLRTGFETPTDALTPVGYNFGTVAREDEDTIAYLIPPTTAELLILLNKSYTRVPYDFTADEDIRAALV
jgi:hypothetical protein